MNEKEGRKYLPLLLLRCAAAVEGRERLKKDKRRSYVDWTACSQREDAKERNTEKEKETTNDLHKPPFFYIIENTTVPSSVSMSYHPTQQSGRDHPHQNQC
jgi:hypothetical protein